MVDYQKVYEIFSRTTPMKTDCGQLCNAACCQIEQYGENMGLYLLPGEEAMHDQNDGWLSWELEDRDKNGLPKSWPEKVWFVRCHGPLRCKRNLRPIQCRSFPCWPYLYENGELAIMIYDFELPYECPLVDDSDNINPAFYEMLYEGWSELLKDEQIKAMIYEDSRLTDEAGIPPMIVYKPELKD
ncbi:MAG: hypothetical protein IJM15_07255 [Erysipelotrichaceae bacterium]|nr:hypothetical protein [Erysipelotrichaceae bacterium]